MLKSKQAILDYFQQNAPGIDQGRSHPLGTFVNDFSFWKKLAIVQKILDPIHKAQYMSEAEGHKLYAVTANWNRLRSHLYTMAKEDEDSEMDLHHIAEIVWEDRYLSQITELHVVAALLVPQNHNIQVIGVSTSQAFFSIMHRFFAEYLNVEEAKSAMKQWLSFRNQEDGFYPASECWTYQTDSELFWNFSRSFAFDLSNIARKVIMLPANSVLAE